jgi:hypothetical protein
MSPAGLAGGAGVAEVAEKLDRVREWLAGSGYGAALFTTQPGVAWVTGGLEDRVVRNEEPALVWALVTESAAGPRDPQLADRREVRGHVRRRPFRRRRARHQHRGLAGHRVRPARHPGYLAKGSV